jgi:predicted HD superfamily hydrolase involved in NAD metabolism
VSPSSNDVERLLRDALAELPSGLAAHVLRVVEETGRLAAAHRIDERAAMVAALGHDLLRAEPPERLLAIASGQGYGADEVERMEPILLHGPLAVAQLQERFGIDDDDVLGAVAFHTTAARHMTPLQKLIFVADKIEPHKAARHPAVARVAELAPRDLDAAMLAYLDHHLVVATETGWPLHPRTVAARNELIAARRR